MKMPSGLSVWLPEDCAKLRQCETSLRELFAEAGAGEIATPSIDYLDVLEKGFGHSRKIFRIADSAGEILGLRPELTTSAARLFASSMASRPRPLKIFYIGQVFRQEPRHHGHFREFRQAGYESYGGDLFIEDVAAITLAARSVAKIGVEGCVIEIGHVGIVESLLDQEKILGARRDEIKDSIRRKSPDGLPEIFRLLLDADITTVRSLTASPNVHSAVDELARIGAALSDLPYKVIFELAATRQIEYYTGIVFEGLMPRLGRPIFSGGRYDRLVEQFGPPAPATGFSLELETLLRR